MKNLTIKRANLTGMMSELDNLIDNVDTAVLKAAEAYCEEGVRNVQQSYLSSIKGAQVGDFIYSSIGFRVTPSNQDGTVAWAGIGVYKIEEIEARFGKTNHDFTAAQLAYWYEFGITRFKSGARKPKKTQWSEVGSSSTVSTVPKPFVSNAMITGDVSRDDAFTNKFNQVIGE